MQLLTQPGDQAKMAKALPHNWYTAALHLAPHTLAGKKSLCPAASPGCIAACLNMSGHGQRTSVQEARIRKTNWFNNHPMAFCKALRGDLARLVKAAVLREMSPAVRLNATSDIQWERWRHLLMDEFPQIQFYDYTKIKDRLSEQHLLPHNYHLTFSLDETNAAYALRVLAAGGTVAAVIEEDTGEWEGYPTLNGDAHDLTFLQPGGHVLALKPKARARADVTGFTIRGNSTPT